MGTGIYIIEKRHPPPMLAWWPKSRAAAAPHHLCRYSTPTMKTKQEGGVEALEINQVEKVAINQVEKVALNQVGKEAKSYSFLFLVLNLSLKISAEKLLVVVG